MFYFSGTDIETGASPETLVKLEGGILHTFPLAGSRPRGKTEVEDITLAKELLCDEKELAEHKMLVDLGRNDLGKICKFGTVKIEKLHSIERYSHVMHIGSSVRGDLKTANMMQLTPLNLFYQREHCREPRKFELVSLIVKLENNKRGVYGGAIDYIDFAGNMDTCIAIRIIYKKNGNVFIRNGAGIVSDSIPENEYQECINKAQASLKALEGTQEVGV